MSDIIMVGISTGRTLSVTRRVLRQIVRDHRTFAMIIVMPIVIMFIFGVALSGEVTHVPITIENQDLGITTPNGTVNFADLIIDNLADDERVDITNMNYETGRTGVEDSDYNAALLFPQDFSESVLNSSVNPNQEIIIQMYLDATKPQIRASIQGALAEAIQSAFDAQGVEIDTEFAYGGVEFTGLETGTPAVMGFVLTFLALLLSLLILIRERVEGTQYRLFATPLKAQERLLGYIIALTIFALLMAGSILTISILLFGVPVQGPFEILVLATITYALVNVLLAVFLSNFAENELQAVQMAPLIALPSMALSGLLVPITTLPAFIQPISNIIPLTYAVIIFEGIMLKGYGFEELLYEFVILISGALVLLIGALITVKDKME